MDLSPFWFGCVGRVSLILEGVVVAMKRPVRDALRKRLLDAAVAKGADPKKVEQVLKELEAERPFLDWLKNGGFEALLKFIMELVKLLG